MSSVRFLRPFLPSGRSPAGGGGKGRGTTGERNKGGQKEREEREKGERGERDRYAEEGRVQIREGRGEETKGGEEGAKDIVWGRKGNEGNGEQKRERDGLWQGRGRGVIRRTKGGFDADGRDLPVEC